MATSLDDFLPLIRGRLIGCPDMILRDALRDTCIEFCKQTQLLSEQIDVQVTAGEASVTLSPSDGEHWVLSALRRETRLLEPSERYHFEQEGLDTRTGTPTHYYLDGPLNLVLGPIPDVDETLSAAVSVRPDDTASSVEDVLYTDYRTTIAAGARAWVRRNYGAWSDPKLEAEDSMIFERDIFRQLHRRARGGSNTPLRVRAHLF
jgi:hypothetical protein